MIPEPIREGNKWKFPDGTILPVISGGDETNFEIPALDLGDIPVKDSPTEPPVGESEPPPPEFSEFAQGILNKIPEQDRNIVAKYIKDWDGNVTKKFQEIHENYKPYKEFGSVEDLKTAMEIISQMNNDPIGFINLMQEALKESGFDMGTEEEYEESGSALPEYENVLLCRIS